MVGRRGRWRGGAIGAESKVTAGGLYISNLRLALYDITNPMRYIARICCLCRHICNPHTARYYSRA